ncbi:membrane protein insertase YidC [Alteromonas sp. LMIT006]|jgi:YidC/Oxa1 family membrane protein insertase|uniref:membrane protein insertase YidC n=1 Tax=Alteromonadaceae TaxID=72275 RepID=UPI0020CA3556|nr:membrane protein insertase YidC [Alteromonas sp. LMIT006]UTP73278.1 membrane protein insertase YidC [Alteromonas sp. LMIT006]
MESQRSFILIGLALVSFLLWQEWQNAYGPQPVVSAEQQVELPSNAVASVAGPQPLGQDVPVGADVPKELQTQASALPVADAAQAQNDRYISVITDTLSLQIDRIGGDVVKADLLKYPVEQGSEEPYSLLRPTVDGLYVAQSGLIGANGPDANPEGRPLYNVHASKFVLEGETLRVPLTWVGNDGIGITKTFIFTRNSHAITLEQSISNNTSGTAVVQPYAQLKQTFDMPEGSAIMPTYRGAAYGTEEEQYSKYSFSDIEDENLRAPTPAGWIAMIEHYFLSAWVPPQDRTNTIYTRAIGTDFATIGYTSEPVSIAQGETAVLNNILYLGPKDQDTLREFAKGLQLTVDYGFLWFISEWLFWLLQIIHGFVNNWGVAIVIITIIVKGLMYPLTKAQYVSMAKMRELTPKIQQLKDRHGDDRQKMSQAMMEMYKKEKVNPMGGCFPLLLQMPIFLALYWVFLESVELRQAPFFLWITDLSVKDPWFVLPILTGVSMWALQKLQPMTMTDEMQKKIMQFMPIMMTIFFMFFPAGLVLYWLISNIITLVQAKMIYAAMEKKGLKSS